MGTSCGQKAISIEQESHRFKHAYVNLPMQKKIQMARMNGGMTQKELAHKLNVKAS